MSTDLNASGGSELNSGGVEDKTKDNLKDAGTELKSKQSVDYETYKKAVDREKNLKKRLDELEAKEKLKLEAELKEKEEYKKLLDLRSQELETERKEKLALKNEREMGLRMNAFLKHVNGKVDQDYWSLIDLEKIAIDPESGMPDDGSAQKAAKEFEARFSRVIEKPTAGKLPAEAAKGGATKLTYDAWLALPYAEKIKRQAEVKLED